MKEGLHVVLCSMSKNSGARVINVEDMTGFSEEVRTFGFTQDGKPVLRPNDPKIFYQLSGAMTGTVNLNAVYSHGVNFNGVQIQGYDAIAALLCRNGLGITGPEVEKQIQKCVKNGMERIYVFRESWWNMLDRSYGLFPDSWEFSGRPDSDTFSPDVINKLLKKLGSPWRIYSRKLAELLQRKEFQKLVSASDL